MLLENQEKGDYTIYLKPEITLSNMSFNVTHPDTDKRKVFADLRFRQAMSMAINRDEINGVALFGQGTPKQYTGFSPLPDFVDKKWESYMIDYNPGKAKSLLDQIGMKDNDGDSFRELPSGKKTGSEHEFLNPRHRSSNCGNGRSKLGGSWNSDHL